MQREPRLDPDGRYPSEGARFVEQRAMALVDWRDGAVVARTRDFIELRFVDPGDDDGELVAVVTPEALELRLPTIEWTEGNRGPARSSRLWRRVKWPEQSTVDMKPWLDRLARALRRSQRQCKHCKMRFLSSRMTGDACHGCAESVDHEVF